MPEVQVLYERHYSKTHDDLKYTLNYYAFLVVTESY